MNRAFPLLGNLLCAYAAFFALLPARAEPVDADILRFVNAKSNRVYRFSQEAHGAIPPDVWNLFSAAAAGNWSSVSNLLGTIRANSTQGAHALPPEVWFRVQDVGGFGSLFESNNVKFVHLFADEVIKAVPRGSIYFGGSDPGRFAVTAFCKSHEDADPFFTLTQNQLADTNYLKYVRAIYHQQIKLPDDAKFAEAFNEYSGDAYRRFTHDRDFPNEPKQVQPGEEIKMVDGKLQITGAASVMAINGILVRDILQENPDKDFYLEESYQLEWMYPYLQPEGLIFKLRHAASDSLFEETVINDHEYWQRLTRKLIGVAVHDDSPVSEICAEGEELNGVPKDFQGDIAFLRSAEARKTFAKSRSAIGGLYTWRAAHSKSSSERRSMLREAELACKQAYLLEPNSPENIWRFATLLVTTSRFDDAQKFLEAAHKANPGDAMINSLVRYAHDMQNWQNANK